jgi:hypothetical protein
MEFMEFIEFMVFIEFMDDAVSRDPGAKLCTVVWYMASLKSLLRLRI